MSEYFEELKPSKRPNDQRPSGAGPTWVDVGRERTGPRRRRAAAGHPASPPRRVARSRFRVIGIGDLLPRSRRNRLLLAVAVAAITVAVLGTVYANAKLSDLPDPGAAPILGKSVVLYDRTGAVLAERNPQGTFHVVQRIGEMGKWGPAATVAAEDHDFYKHGALDFAGVARAVLTDTLAGKPVQGGSTISQQLVKITVLESDKTFTRKVKEAFIASQLEQKYSKDQILEMYLNRVYYGHGAYGIGSATKTYFGAAKETKDLNIAQGAFLAGLIQAPSSDDPAVHFDRARGRQLYVIGEMEKAGVITKAEGDAAAAEPIQSELVYDTSYRETRAPHFVDYVMNKLKDQLGPYAVAHGGISVYTTLDPTIQTLAEQSVARGVKEMAYYGVNNGDLLAARPSTGEVLAWVGSADYGNSTIGGQFDVIRSPRQPGSSFKPYVYEAALKDHKITLNSCVQDRPTNFNGYKPLDYDNRYMGTMTARQALLLSRNIPAVEVAQKEGITNVDSLAAQMGISTKLNPYLSTAIGGSEVTMFDHLQGYAVFANEGHKVPLVSIVKIVGADKNVVYQVSPGHQDGQQQVLTPAEAYLITDTLKGYPAQWDLGWQRTMAGKSGTTGGNASGVHPDAWMMAYNKDIVVGTWAGNTGPDGGGKPVSAYGVNAGETTLAAFINGLPAQWNSWFQPPAGIVSRAGEVFLSGTENTPACNDHGSKQEGGDENPLPFPLPFSPPGGGEHGHHGGH